MRQTANRRILIHPDSPRRGKQLIKGGLDLLRPGSEPTDVLTATNRAVPRKRLNPSAIMTDQAIRPGIEPIR